MAEGQPRGPLTTLNRGAPCLNRGPLKKRRLGADGTYKETTRNIRKSFDCMFPGTLEEAQAAKAEMTAKITQVKELMGSVQDTTTTEMMRSLLDCYLWTHGRNTSSSSSPSPHCDYQRCEDDRREQQLFITAQDSLKHLLQTARHHSSRCKEDLRIDSLLLRGHTGIVKLRCRRGCSHQWTSSPHIGQPFLVNLRMAHAYMSSGILPNQYERICTNGGIGMISEENQKKSMILYGQVVREKKEASMLNAMNEESERRISDNKQLLNIVTDARHAQRRNSHRSDIMALGQSNHRVLAHMPVRVGAPVKTHFYWCMARCGGSEQVLRDLLLNIVEHYQNEHVDRPATSRYLRYTVTNPRRNEGQRVLTAKTYRFLRDLLLTFLDRVRALERLPPLPPRRRQRQQQQELEDGDRYTDTDSGSDYSEDEQDV